MSSSIIPVMLWAQDKTHLFVTVQIVDAKDTKIDLTENKFSFAGSSGNKTYALDFEFADAIVPDESKTKTWGNRVEFFIAKKDKDADEYWEHVLKDPKSIARHLCKTDFDHWVDEDDAEEESLAQYSEGMQGMPGMGGGQGGMPGMGGMGGMGGQGGAPGGMDMAQLQAMMAQMGQGGGMPGMGGGQGGMPDMSEMLKSMGGGMPGGAPAEEVDSDDEELPDLED